MRVANALCLSRFVRDERGSSMVEFTLVFVLMIVAVSGVIEFGAGWYQWNLANKAMQLGVRLAAVSDPVDSSLTGITGLEDGAEVGSRDTPAYSRKCYGSSSSCDGGGTYNAAAMSTLVYGRGNNSCGTLGPDGFPGMCDVFPRLTPANVTITYSNTGMGFAGRPGGPVPTITIELTGLTFRFAFLQAVLGFGDLTMPRMQTTATGEDLSTTFN